jgi:hypothetical protein
MDGASSKRSGLHTGRASLEGAIQSELRDRDIRLLKGIVLILIVALAIGFLACATLALVGLDCPMRGISHGWA